MESPVKRKDDRIGNTILGAIIKPVFSLWI